MKTKWTPISQKSHLGKPKKEKLGSQFVKR